MKHWYQIMNYRLMNSHLFFRILTKELRNFRHYAFNSSILYLRLTWQCFLLRNVQSQYQKYFVCAYWNAHYFFSFYYQRCSAFTTNKGPKVQHRNTRVRIVNTQRDLVVEKFMVLSFIIQIPKSWCVLIKLAIALREKRTMDL